MKTYSQFFILLMAIIAYPQLSYSQGPITRPGGTIPAKTINPKLLQRTPLDWYFSAIRPARASGGAPANTITTRNSGANTSIVGVNLPRAAVPVRAVGTPGKEPSGDGYCLTQSYNLDYLNESAFSLIDLRLNFPNAIYPGAFIDAGSLLGRSPVTYVSPAQRRPLTVAISISNPDSGSRTYTVSNFGSNNNRVLDENLRDRHYGAAIPSVFAYRSMELRSQQELTASFNFSAGLMLPLEEFGIPLDLSQGIRASGNMVNGSVERQYMLSFIQPMYAYTIEEEDPGLLFTNAGAAANIHQGIVKSVVYGRMIMMTFRSTLDSAEAFGRVSARLGINFTGGELANASLGGSISGDVRNKFVRDIKEFKALVYGGNGQTANSVAGDPEAVYQYIRDPSAATLNSRTGALPLQYVVQRISDGRIIGVRSTSNYKVDDCLNPRYDVEVSFKGLKCYKVVELFPDDKEDIFGTCDVNGKRLFGINEDAAWSIGKDKTISDDKDVLIAKDLTLAQVRELQLVFSQALKDWEPLHKPVYRAYQPLDLKYSLDKTANINAIMNLAAGRSVELENKTHEVRLYENGDREHSSIAVLYRVKVTRK